MASTLGNCWDHLLSRNILMNVGDTVRKIAGEQDLGKSGQVEMILYNAKGEKILSVMTVELYGNRHAVAEPWAQSNMGGAATRMKRWLASNCEVIDENR